jgi:exosortase D (VPLPA-CTERM-specific)
MTTADTIFNRSYLGWMNWGLFWLTVGTIAAAVFFKDGFDVLFDAWKEPEYSHGPLIPVLSALMFLRDLKQHPSQLGVKQERWQGVLVIVLSIIIAMIGTVFHAASLLAYAIIVWVGGILLISFGWQTGKYFWPSVLHLVFMLPLPGMLYYQVSTFLQLVSSELGVWFLQIAGVPVYLDGNIIDLGVLKMHVAEACSGLRYLFPILSFSYIFAFLYQGPAWHKVVLLLAAAPIAIFMNSVRIAIAGILVQQFGVEWLEGFTHFFEGWVIFMASIMILIGTAWIMLQLNPHKMRLVEAFDLEIDEILPQLKRLRFAQSSPALIIATIIMVVSATAWPLMPQRVAVAPDRATFSLFPYELGDWRQFGAERRFSPEIERSLSADDYHAVQFGRSPDEPRLDFFSAWYRDLSEDGVQHTPEICLPGAGWEIAEVERVDLSGDLGLESPFRVNRLILQKGEDRMLVYYWFTHLGRAIPSNAEAKISVLTKGVFADRLDGAILRIISPIDENNTETKAEALMIDLLREALPHLPRFIPGE